MKRSLPAAFAMLLMALVLLASSCTKNEFTLEGRISGGESSTLYLSWRAASGTRDFMASQAVPLTASEFKVTGPVKKPSVIWVFSASRSLLTAIYVERGDKLRVNGTINSPLTWQVEGNKVMEQVSSWTKQNEATLKKDDPKAVNRLVEDYIKSNPDSRTALFLLLTRYDRSLPGNSYAKLMAGFKDEKLRTEMLAACLEPNEANTALPADRHKRIEQVLASDDDLHAEDNDSTEADQSTEENPSREE